MTASPTQFASYFRWEEISGAPAKLAELQGRLKALPRDRLVEACAFLNVTLKTWTGTVDIEQHADLLRFFFAEPFVGRLDAAARRPQDSRFVFHRQQLLFLIKQAVLHGSRTAGIDPSFNSEFAKCCLMVNDLLHYDVESNPAISKPDTIMPDMVTVNEYTYREDFIRKAARAKLIFEEIQNSPTLKAKKEYLDLNSIFLGTTGLSIREYSSLLIATLAKYQNVDLKSYQEDRGSFVVLPEHSD